MVLNKKLILKFLSISTNQIAETEDCVVLFFVYQVRNSGAAVRRNLFESERGICQLCSLNAHEMYIAVKALTVKERPAFLAGTVYATLPKQTLKRMVMDPKEGMVSL